MNKLWQDEAWEDYIYWQKQDKKTLKPEPLKGNYSGWWSRRINETDRLVYRIKNGQIEIAQCHSHYNEK